MNLYQRRVKSAVSNDARPVKEIRASPELFAGDAHPEASQYLPNDGSGFSRPASYNDVSFTGSLCLSLDTPSAKNLDKVHRVYTYSDKTKRSNHSPDR
jgi:hypothetical protein